MILKRHTDPSHPLGWSASYTDDAGKHRYALVNVMGSKALAARREPRRWAVFITMHPVKQGPTDYGETDTRCVRRAKSLGFDGTVMLHLCSLVASDPPEVALYGEGAIGAYTDRVHDAVLGKTASFIGVDDSLHVIAGWGEYGHLFGRGDHMLKRLAQWKGGPVSHFGLLKSGDPRQPLYVPNGAKLQRLEGAGA